MRAYLFPGQGSQYPGMGQDILALGEKAVQRLQEAVTILGFPIDEVLHHGTEEDLRQTRVTQPAIFLHSVILAEVMGDRFQPGMVAGHSLGEFSALTATGALTFEDGLRLVSLRASAMQKACEEQASTMAAVLGLDDDKVVALCQEVSQYAEETGTGQIVVAANFNCPGQVVISGGPMAVELASQKATETGALKVIPLSVSGAFHSPYMQSAASALNAALASTEIRTPRCPVYQNVAPCESRIDPSLIREGLSRQLTETVQWTQSIRAMLQGGANEFTELGPGKVLQGLLRKIDRQAIFVQA
ncbi:MAG: ACP S-malonyltransferase [Sphingomonadales bacterium]|nr:ACP S-malonyltransferase [Sphingomonadales bacterium]